MACSVIYTNETVVLSLPADSVRVEPLTRAVPKPIRLFGRDWRLERVGGITSPSAPRAPHARPAPAQTASIEVQPGTPEHSTPTRRSSLRPLRLKPSSQVLGQRVIQPPSAVMRGDPETTGFPGATRGTLSQGEPDRGDQLPAASRLDSIRLFRLTPSFHARFRLAVHHSDAASPQLSPADVDLPAARGPPDRDVTRPAETTEFHVGRSTAAKPRGSTAVLQPVAETETPEPAIPTFRSSLRPLRLRPTYESLTRFPAHFDRQVYAAVSSPTSLLG